jgi:hypothetical protein
MLGEEINQMVFEDIEQLLRKELEKRLEFKGYKFEWADICQDLEAL